MMFERRESGLKSAEWRVEREAFSLSFSLFSL